MSWRRRLALINMTSVFLGADRRPGGAAAGIEDGKRGRLCPADGLAGSRIRGDSDLPVVFLAPRQSTEMEWSFILNHDPLTSNTTGEQMAQLVNGARSSQTERDRGRRAVGLGKEIGTGDGGVSRHRPLGCWM